MPRLRFSTVGVRGGSAASEIPLQRRLRKQWKDEIQINQEFRTDLYRNVVQFITFCHTHIPAIIANAEQFATNHARAAEMS
jgi:hypothetical protein